MTIFGNELSRPTQWLQAGLHQSRRVGRIESPHSSGSGFLFDGGLFGKKFKGLPFFLTCSFCVSGNGSEMGADMNSATVVFEGMFDDSSRTITSPFALSLAESPVEELGYSLLLLPHWTGKVPELLPAPTTPKVGDKIFVVSYPRGGGLAITLDDNEVISDEVVFFNNKLQSAFYYRAPTEPGSSGSPVFNENWEVVGIHVGGRRSVANFGVLFSAVRTDAESKLAAIEIPGQIADKARMSLDSGVEVVNNEPDYYSVFISYSHEDSVFAHRLYNALQSSGVRAWLDEKQLLPGDDIYEEIQKGIQGWDKVLLCCSRSSLTSWWVDSEINRAFQKEVELFRNRKRKIRALIPLNLDGFLLNGWESGKAEEVKSRLAADFTGWVDDVRFESAFEALLKALRADKAREQPPASKL